MKYMGSKIRIAPEITQILHERIEDYKIKRYIEPFVGGANIIDKIQCEQRIGSDNNEYLIALLQNTNRLNLLPEYISKEHYAQVRESYNRHDGIFEKWYIGAIGFLSSYNGRFFEGGYGAHIQTKSGIVRNYYNEAKRNLENQAQHLQGIEFLCGDYAELYGSEIYDCLFYCDIPYKDTKQYATSKNFDHEKFWKWAERMSERNIVIVSECQAPKNWECIWQQEVKRTNNIKTKKSIERLFEIRE